ncbi:CDP-alcohol phosphatidyltransferase family protein [Cerasicoccus frondis]|uniref:CDP-alcohol phosphatidyltransferase family protein n=1 Tax=Cerasicoccus frondis TaxID=490090 RepID=UPI0028525C3E|nr:CDP-alcohol phosphatidyltransferase family protein [Cerasicoccus frondis]
MSIYELKTRFQNLLRPICQDLARRGVTANQVTLAAMLLSILLGLLLWWSGGSRWVLMLVPIWLFIRMALNAIDGMLAREHDMKSSLGAVLNELGDVVSDTALYLPFAVIPGAPSGLFAIFVVLAILSEMTGVVCVQIGASRRYDGPMGKSDRAFVIGLLAFLIAVGATPGAWLFWWMAVVNVLLVVTVLNRAWRGLCEVK